MSQKQLEEALKNWQEKLAFLEVKLSITAHAAEEFELKKNIERCETEIQRLKTSLTNVNNFNRQQVLHKAELYSERGIDYTKLESLLAAGEWREADEETARVMCLAAGKGKEGYLRGEDIDNFPCEDLRTINQLWLNYSNRKFGFSIQKDIHQSLGGTREYNKEVMKKFGEYVGWYVEGNWLSYDCFTFNLNTPRGHLPITFGCFGRMRGIGLAIVGNTVNSLLSRKDL
jgi:hypothetical protein